MLPREMAAKIHKFFAHRWIVVRDVDRIVAERARELVWDHRVTPKDSIHLATALTSGVDIEQFDTFDDKLIELSGKLGNPALLIGHPNLHEKLPFERDSPEPV